MALIESNRTIPLYASYDDEFFSTRPLLLLALKNWIDDDINNVINNKMPLFSAMFGIRKNDKEALQSLLAYISQKGGPSAFKRRPVYLMSFGYGIFIYATQILKQDVLSKVKSGDDSWIDLLANSLNAGEYTAKIIRENFLLSKKGCSERTP